MQVLATTKYGPLDQLQTLELPAFEPQQGEVRVRVIASALNPADYKVILGTLKVFAWQKFPHGGGL